MFTNEGTDTALAKSNLEDVQAGDVYSRHSFGTVKEVYPDRIRVQNENGYEWHIDREVFEREFTIATHAAQEAIVSQTELIAEIMRRPRTACTIHFRKKVNPADVTKALRAVLEDVEPGNRKFASAVKEAVAGEPRTMIGWHYGDLDDRGRLRFFEHGKGPRLIDPRTVEYAILNNVRYTVA